MINGQDDSEEGQANRRLVIMLLAGLVMIVIGMVIVFVVIP